MKILQLVPIGLLTFQAASAGTDRVQVTGNYVSLRALPDLNSDLLDRAMLGNEFIRLGATNGWVAVKPPGYIDAWVAGEHLSNNVVVPPKLNVRSGPSINYNVLAVVRQGTVIDPLDAFNGWIKIPPPEGARVWISADFVEAVESDSEVIGAEPEPLRR